MEAKFWAKGQNLEVLQSVPRCYKPWVNLYEVYAGHLISMVKVSFRVRHVLSHALDFTSLSFNHLQHSDKMRRSAHPGMVEIICFSFFPTGRLVACPKLLRPYRPTQLCMWHACVCDCTFLTGRYGSAMRRGILLCSQNLTTARYFWCNVNF
jgi:hypothetical protein